jgi:hypothetical protein
MMDVRYKNYTNPTNTWCGQNAEVRTATAAGAYYNAAI